MFFQAQGTSGSFDRYLTTIKNSYKQGKLLGRAQEGGEEGTYPSDPYHTFQRGTRFFPTLWKKKENHKSVSFTDLWHELRCFCSARHICFTQWLCLWAVNAWILINHPPDLHFCRKTVSNSLFFFQHCIKGRLSHYQLLKEKKGHILLHENPSLYSQQIMSAAQDCGGKGDLGYMSSS